MTNRRFVALDRDGTIIVERNYLADAAHVALIPGAADGLRKLQDLGLGLVIVTNQSGIARGYFSDAQLELIHRKLLTMLAAEGVEIQGVYVCPHAPEDNCRCRKPRAGLLEAAAREQGFSPQRSFVIGDKACDIGLGRAVGAKAFLVRTGYGAKVETEGSCAADYVVDDLLAAAAAIERLLLVASWGEK